MWTTSTQTNLTSWSPVCPGPFWICVTLVFSLAISGNLSTFLNSLGSTHYHYRPQFHRGMVPGGYSLAPCQWFHVRFAIDIQKGDCWLIFTFQHRGLFQDHVILHAIAVLLLLAFSHSLSDDSCSSDLPVCLAGAPGCMGFPDLEAEGGEAAEWLLLPGDGVCLRLLPLHLHPHLSESADTH